MSPALYRWLVYGFAVAAIVASLSIAVAPAWAARGTPGMPDDSPLTINISTGHPSAQIVVPANKSKLVHFDRPFREISVGSKEIAEVVPISRSTIYVLGKKRGATNLTITGGAREIIAVVDVVVTYDVDGLRRQLAAIVPDENIEIRPAGDALVLSGMVSNASSLRQISQIAERFAPGAVTNLLAIGGSQQVMLDVKFSEVQRSSMRDVGLKTLNGLAVNNPGSGGPNNVMIPVPCASNVSWPCFIQGPPIPQNSNLPTPVPPNIGNALGEIGGLFSDYRTFWLRGTINALEKEGLVRTLAQPNLVALSGDTASFLAGGEFPIPVVQSQSGGAPTTTIEFKQFGVGLSFTPTVLTSDLVNLVMKSEVSAIDPTVSVTTNGINVPGLKVRRTTTTVELRDGATFAIAGLLQDDFTNTINRIPGIGNIPVLGALFSSFNFQHQETELVVFVTVHLVQPTIASNLSAPTDRTGRPTNGSFYFEGEPQSQTAPPASRPLPSNESNAVPAAQPSAPQAPSVQAPPAATQSAPVESKPVAMREAPRVVMQRIPTQEQKSPSSAPALRASDTSSGGYLVP